MKKLLLAFIIAFCSTSLTVVCQNQKALNDSLKNNTDDFYYRGNYFGAGVQAGLTSGAGLSGKYVSEKGFTVGGTVFAMTFGDWFHYNLGVEGQYSFIRDVSNRYFATFGLGYYNSTTKDLAYPGNRIANPFRFGIGIGYEWFLNKRFAASLSLPITYFPTTSEVYPTPQIGLFMYFQ